jgi:uncharacterized membrane protein
MNERMTRRPLIAAGTLLGIGMGGFVDGIVFHQLLQVHNMLSAQYPTTGLDAERLVVNLLDLIHDSVGALLPPPRGSRGSLRRPSPRPSCG